MNEVTSEIVILWFLTGGAVLIMLLRLALRQHRQQSYTLGDYFTIAAIVSILLRGAVIHVPLLWGTNSISAAVRKTMDFTPEVIYRHEIGAKLTIVNRVFYTVYTWLQKCVVMCVIQRLLQGLMLERITTFYWATLATTFLVATIVTFTECHPFHLYWQVVPNPGTCAKGIVQLEVFSALNMATDLMLIALPLPHLISIKRPLTERLRLVALFLVGLTIVAVTMTRLLMNVLLFHRSGASHNVANVEIFFAAFVANSPTIYGLIRLEAGRRGTTSARYVSDVYAGPNSGGFKSSSSAGAHSIQPGDTLQINLWRAKRPSGRESDEELMIELRNWKRTGIYVTTTTTATASKE